MRTFSRFINLLIIIVLLVSGVTSYSYSQEIFTLKKALDIAMDKSPEMQRVAFSLERSRQLLKAQEASLKSNFALSVTPYSYSKNRTFNNLFSIWNTEETKRSNAQFIISQPIQWTDGTLQLINNFSWQEAYSEFRSAERNRSFNNNLYLRFEQPIFTYNRTQLAMKGVRLDLENAALNFAIQKLQIEKLVTQNFYNLFYRKRSLEIEIEGAKNREESYEVIKKKVEAGIAAREELLQAEINLANSRSAVEDARVVLANTEDEFKDLLGISLFEDIQVEADIAHKEVPVDLVKATENGQKHRMEIRQREIALQNAMDVLVETSAMNEFNGSVNLTYGIIGTNEDFNLLYDDPTQNQQYSISFQIPLFDWGEKKARIKAQETTIKQRKLEQRQMGNDIIIGIRQAYRQLLNQKSQIEIAKVNEANAQLTYEINLERYKNGDLSSKDLGDYQNQLSRQKLAYLNALIQYQLGLLDMKIQSLWDFEKNTSVIPNFEGIK
ncbi:TolC family protein [candidate division KSB1 bacterium]|nr:TolC family protein [candidate division KSB1 bacterium]